MFIFDRFHIVPHVYEAVTPTPSLRMTNEETRV